MTDSYLKVPAGAMGLKLHKHVGNELVSCELVMFREPGAVDTVLRRAHLSGRVEIGGKIDDYFADIYDATGDSWFETVSLDRNSYSILKNHWMRCKIERSP